MGERKLEKAASFFCFFVVVFGGWWLNNIVINKILTCGMRGPATGSSNHDAPVNFPDQDLMVQ